MTDDGEDDEGQIRSLMERTRRKLDKRGEAMANDFLARMNWPKRAATRKKKSRSRKTSGEIEN